MYVESMSRSSSRVSANAVNLGLSLGLDDQHEVTISHLQQTQYREKLIFLCYYIATLCKLTQCALFLMDAWWV